MTHTLPPGWEEKKLEDIVSVLNGLWTGKTPPYCQAFVIRNTNFTKDCRLDLSDVANLQVEQRQFDNRELKKGDILVEKSGGGPKQPVGRVVLFDKTERSFSFSNFTSVLRIKNPTVISYYFLYWLLYFCYLSGKTIPMQKYTTGIRNLQMSEYKELKISFPPLVEQKRIVEKLDKIFADIDKAKENTQKNLANAKELFKNSLDMLLEQDKERYPITSLGRVATLIPGIAFKSKEFGNFPQKAVKISNILPPKISNSLDGVDIGAYNKEKISKYLLRKGDICVAMTGGTIGKLGMYDLERETYVNQRVLLIRSTSEINCKFLHYILMHPKFLLFIKSNIESDTAQPNISADTIGKYKFFLPTIDKQRVLLKRLTESENKTQELEQIYTKKLVNLEELKQSVLQQAFSGKL